MQGEVNSGRGKALQLHTLGFVLRTVRWRVIRGCEKGLIRSSCGLESFLQQDLPPFDRTGGWYCRELSLFPFHVALASCILKYEIGGGLGKMGSNLTIISYRQLGDREKEVQMGSYRQGVTGTVKDLSKYPGRATKGIRVRNNSGSCCLLHRSCRIFLKYLPPNFRYYCWAVENTQGLKNKQIC